MKKLFKAILFFIPFFIIFYIISIIVFGELISNELLKKNLNYNASSGHSFTRFKQVKDIKDIDILFIGASNAYRGFDTRIYEKNNYSVFNLGSSSQTPLQTEILLKRYLTQLNPKIIIYAVDADAFCSDGIESSLDLISNDNIDLDILKLIALQNHLKLYNTTIYALFKNITGRFSNYNQPKKIGKDTYIKNGFVIQELKYYKKKQFKKNSFSFNNKQFEAFKRIIKIVKNKKIFLVNPPIVKAKFNSFSNENEFDEKLKKYGSYYNFNKILSLNDSMFYDENHLNVNGVKIFNNRILELLENN